MIMANAALSQSLAGDISPKLRRHVDRRNRTARVHGLPGGIEWVAQAVGATDAPHGLI